MDPVHRGGPRTRSIEGVHGPSPDKGSIDRGSMFCTFPLRKKSSQFFLFPHLVVTTEKHFNCHGLTRFDFYCYISDDFVYLCPTVSEIVFKGVIRLLVFKIIAWNFENR